MITQKLVLLCGGGWNAEKMVSLLSAASVYDSLIEQGYQVTWYKSDVILKSFVQYWNAAKMMFNAVPGIYVEDEAVTGSIGYFKMYFYHSMHCANNLYA